MKDRRGIGVGRVDRVRSGATGAAKRCGECDQIGLELAAQNRADAALAQELARSAAHRGHTHRCAPSGFRARTRSITGSARRVAVCIGRNSATRSAPRTASAIESRPRHVGDRHVDAGALQPGRRRRDPERLTAELVGGNQQRAQCESNPQSMELSYLHVPQGISREAELLGVARAARRGDAQGAAGARAVLLRPETSGEPSALRLPPRARRRAAVLGRARRGRRSIRRSSASR